MRYIVRTLRFTDGEMRRPDDDGWANWRVVAVLRTEHVGSGNPDSKVYVQCLIEDRT